jgi:hypothetical protein
VSQAHRACSHRQKIAQDGEYFDEKLGDGWSAILQQCWGLACEQRPCRAVLRLPKVTDT